MILEPNASAIRNSNIRTVVAVFAIFCLALNSQAYSYVSVAPTAIFLSDAQRTGEIIVQNNANHEVEIVIEFRFGYPVSDTTGRVGLKFLSEISISEPCAAEWIHAYPKKFILYPRQSRTVRFMIRPPAGLDEGEYWARPVVISRIHRPMPETIQNASTIRARVNTAIESVLSLSFRHGKVSTGALLTDVSVQRQDDRLLIMPSAIREGNAAYIGFAVARLYDEKNNLVKEVSREVAIYYALRIRLELNINDLPQGTYRAEVEFNTDRPGAYGEILKAPPQVRAIELALV